MSFAHFKGQLATGHQAPEEQEKHEAKTCNTISFNNSSVIT